MVRSIIHMCMIQRQHWVDSMYFPSVVCLQRETSMQNSKEDVNELLQCKACDRWCVHVGKDSWAHHPYESAGLNICIFSQFLNEQS